MKSLTARLTLSVLFLDLVFGILITLVYVRLLSIQRPGEAIWCFLGLLVLKMLASVRYLSSRLSPYESWKRAQARSSSAEHVQAADAALQALPRQFSKFYGWSWIAMLGGGYLLLRLLAAEHFGLAPQVAHVVLLLLSAMWLGAFTFVFPGLTYYTSEPAGECARIASAHGITLSRPPVTLQNRIIAIALCLGLGPMFWIIGTGYASQVDERRTNVSLRSSLEALELARIFDHHPEHRITPRSDEDSSAHYLLTSQGEILSGSRPPRPEEQSLLQSLSRQVSGPNGTLAAREQGLEASYSRLEDGRLAAVIISMPTVAGESFLIGAGVFTLIILLWAPICAVSLARAISDPIERLTKTAQRIVLEGNQSELDNLDVIRNDEVGLLSEQFNDLLQMMRDLSRAADSIADGDLRVQVHREGELPNAFRRMVESLRTVVGEIRQTSVELAGAATEIFAASQEQEAAATSQSSAMTEISHTMDSLSESAAHVSEAVQGVLSNAEQTLVTTDTMVERIEGLSAHTGRITELLDVIRDIADRSDLLALNGSLEASRAGEGGQGFALVAGEMRRLAERVTASVQDVKKLVTDIRESSASTIMATEESRRLARGTTDAARQITFVSQQQRSGTEQVSQSVKEITDVVTQAAAATSQTRTSAQNLKEQADRMGALVKRFEVTAEVV